MPRDFDKAHQTYRFVAVDMSTSPPVLASSSGFMESKVIDYITSSDNAGRAFRIFDFKRFVELHYPGTGRKLIKGSSFDWRTGASNADQRAIASRPESDRGVPQTPTPGEDRS